MLELNCTKIRRDNVTIRERWFVDKKVKGLTGDCMVNLFNSDSEDECIEFMRKYHDER